jgi:acetyltransferase-like isoleucine patch superfamily enzyme
MSHVASSAVVAANCRVSPTARIWDFAQLREEVSIGDNVVIGRNVYVGPGVEVGAQSKIQNDAKVYEPASIGSGVFIGPGVILTNDRNPRAVTASMKQKSIHDWVPAGVVIEDGASIGAGAICIAPVRIGTWALVAAGSVVVNDVGAFSLVAGNPARQIGWVGESGYALQLNPDSSGRWSCPATGWQYREVDGAMTRV